MSAGIRSGVNPANADVGVAGTDEQHLPVDRAPRGRGEPGQRHVVEVPGEPPLLTPELARVLLRILRRAEAAITADEDPTQ